MAVDEFVVEFTSHSSFSFQIAIATMPFDADIYFNDFVFQFFSLKLTRFGIFSFKKLCRLKLEFCFFICRK